VPYKPRLIPEDPGYPLDPELQDPEPHVPDGPKYPFDPGPQEPEDPEELHELDPGELQDPDDPL